MITKDHIGGAFPSVPLGEVVEFLDHKRRPITAKDRVAGPIPYYGANGQQDSVADYIFDEPLILVAEDGGHFDDPDRGIAYRINGRSWVNNHAHVLRPRSKMDLAFLCRVLENYDVRPYISGSTRGKLTKGQASKIKVPLPPLPEQRRIAAILDQADALRRLRRLSLSRLSDLGQAIFQDMFGDVVANERQFEWSSIGDLVSGFDTGKNLAPDPDNATARNFVLKVSAVTKGIFDPAESKPLPDSYSPPVSHFVRKGDLLFSRANTENLIGATALVEHDVSNIVLPDKIWRFRWRNGNEALFVHHLFQSKGMRRQISRRASGTSGSMKNIGKEKVLSISIGLPTFSERQRFDQAVRQIGGAFQTVESAVTQADTLFISLQHRAFRGEL